MKIAIILGSTRPTRISPTLGTWIADALRGHGLDVEIIDLIQVDLPFLNEPEQPSLHLYRNESTKRWSEIVSQYDGFILLSAQYNWGYPEVLKNALDTLYDEWRGKPVSVVTYGGHGGFQAALALGLVLRGLRMRTLATNPQITIHDDIDRDAEGKLTDVDRMMKPYETAFANVAQEFLTLQS
ncbi:NADPH-dependent FMN reductase [Bifidobacterium aquikefiri]|uniref:NADPH-dependent FMN reductase n=1 Tax=Bifidobacterium aquikefiri TaxID=1653207 RepID=UPI0023F135BF|nr:NADPH-dependent FMN reductase [Bifidobacterium aquikefiri]